jgi:multiple sugar transport system permease protein
MKLGRVIYWIVFVSALAVITIFYIGPLIWVILVSLRPEVERFSFSLPSSITWERYSAVLFDYRFYPTLINSIKVCLVTTAAVLLVATPASYAIVRLKRLKLRGPIFMLFLLTFIFPGIAYLGYIYSVISSAGLFNTISGLIVVYSSLQVSGSIWLLSSFMRGIPVEVEEAGLIDGCNNRQVFTRIILPLMLTGLGITAIFTFIGVWGEFTIMYSITMTNSARTVTGGVIQFTGVHELNWSEISTASVIAMIPPVALALAAQKFIISGLTAGIGK